MKKIKLFITLTVTSVALVTAQAQRQGAGGTSAGGPHFSVAISTLFGDHQAFTTDMQFEMPEPSSGRTVIIPGKMSFDSGKSRFEMNISDIKGSAMPPSAAAQMKAMGMDAVITISRPDKQVAWIVYNGMQSYFESPLIDKSDTAPVTDFTSTVTPLGKENFNGHDCVKNKVVVTDKDSNTNVFTVWNATDLKNFPVRIEATQSGARSVISFQNVTFTKPDAGAFEAPAGYTKYPSPQAMVQAVMTKKMGGMGLTPPPGH